MYRRYSQVQGEGMSRSQRKGNLIRNAIIFLLTAALIVLGIFSFTTFQQNGENKQVMISRILKEYREAETECKKLSRTGGEVNIPSLSKIRGNVQTIRALNDIYPKDKGKNLVSEETLTNILNAIDKYFTDSSQSGINTGAIVDQIMGYITSLKLELPMSAEEQ